jgi:hypothetical protein
MIKDTSSTEDDFVRLDEEEMTREGEAEPDPVPKEEGDEDEEPPLFSNVFAIEQLKSGAAQAASFFSWGLTAVKTKATELTESEKVKQLLDSTKPQREAISTNAASLWESTRPQREDIARTAASLSEQVQPTLSKLKTDTAKAIESISTGIFDEQQEGGQDQRMTSGTAAEES